MKKIISVALLLVLTFSIVVFAQADTEENMYYLFDTRIIEEVENAELVLGSVEKSVTLSSWLDQYNWTPDSDIPEWENRVTIMYPHVIYDENGISVDGVSAAKYKIWYHSYCTKNPNSDYDWCDFIIDKSNSRNVDIGGFENDARGTFHWQGYALCYMESNDGISWTRPDCGEFYYKKQNGEIVGTNIVMIGQHGTGVHLNTHPNAGKEEPLYIMATTGTALSWSDDGIHWETPVTIKDGNKTENYMPGDTHNQIMWSPELERYVVISRGFINGVRTVLQFTSTDELVSLRDMTAIGSYEERTKYWTEPQHVLTGALDAQPYSVPIIYAADGYYIGVVSMSNFDRSTDGVYQQVWAELVWSPDCTNWFYIKNGTPFIANAESFVFEKGNDYGMIFCAAPVLTNEGTRIFYAAVPELHYFNYNEIPDYIKEIMKTEAPSAVEAKFITRTTTLNYASFPTDRYAGYYSDNGALTTSTFRIFGNCLTVNTDIDEGGSIKAALLDNDGNIIDGFSYDDMRLQTVDAVNTRIEWSTPLEALSGQSVRIAFKMKNATLYTISGDVEACELVDLVADKQSVVITEGQSETVNVKIVPDMAYDKASLIYTTSDSSVAYLDGNKITGYSAGEAVITVSTPDKKYSVDILVKVNSFATPYFFDDFEKGLSGWMVRDSSSGWNDSAPYTYIKLDGTSHSGNQSLGLSRKGKQVLIRKNFGEKLNKVFSVWFYDDLSATDSRVKACVEWGTANRLALGVRSSTSDKNYYFGVNSAAYTDTGIARTNGWHQFTWDYTSGTHTDVYIDGVKVATNTSTGSFEQVTLGWWSSAVSTVNYFDDVCISDSLPWESSLLMGAENLTANRVGNSVVLNWDNPLNPDWYESMVIVRSLEGMPNSVSDGDIVAKITDKSVSSYVDTVANGDICYYAVFATSGTRTSSGAFAEVRITRLGAEAEKASYRYMKQSAAGLSIPIKMNEATALISVSMDKNLLTEAEYSFEDSTIYIEKEYLQGLEAGSHILSADFDIGELTVKIDVMTWYFYEDFECGFDETNLSRIKDGSGWVTAEEGYSSLKNAVITRTEDAHSGEYVFQNANSQIALVEKVFEADCRKVAHAWFYDDGVSNENDTYVKVLRNGAPLVGIGIKGSSKQYSYLYYSGVYVNTGIQRTKGWHCFSFDFTNGYPELYIDFVKVASLSGSPSGSTAFPMTNFNKIWAGWFVGSNSGCAFDDIYVTDTLYGREAVEIKGTSLVIDQAVGVRTYVDIDERQIAASSVTVNTEIYDSETTESVSSDSLLHFDEEKGLYYVEASVPPKDADNYIIKHTFGYREKEISLPAFTVCDYINEFQKLAETNEEYASALDLVNAFEIYVSNADAFFGGKPTASVYADIGEITKPSATGVCEGVTLYSTSLVLEDKIKIRHYFQVADGITPVFKSGDAILDAREKNGLIYVDIDNISVADINETYTLTVSDCLNISFSVLNYIEFASETDNTSLKNLMNSFYNYWYHINQYQK